MCILTTVINSAASHGWRVVSVRFSILVRKCKQAESHGGTIPGPRSVRGTGQPEPNLINPCRGSLRQH